MIAHRLKIVQSAGQILVLNHAHIVQCDTHADLIQQKGLYAGFITVKQEAGTMSGRNTIHVSGEDDSEAVLILQRKRRGMFC